MTERIASQDFEVFDAMKEKVHPGDSGRRQVFLLTVQLAPKRLYASACFIYMIYRLNEHTPRSAGWVVDRFPFARIENPDHQIDDAARRIKLAGLLVGRVGKF